MVITKKEELKKLERNSFIGTLPELIDSSITFSGFNNILLCEKGVILKNSSIEFAANNSIIYLSSSHSEYFAKIVTFSNSVCFIGKDNYINNTITLILSEGKNIFIGNGCCISLGIWMRNADPHLIFSAKDKSRINHSRSIYIGDHVWIGQNAMILKGSIIHSGSIIGAMSLVAGKTVNSNTCWGGNPVVKLKDDIFWSGECVHSWTEETTKKNNIFLRDDYCFNHDGNVINFENLDMQLQSEKSAIDKLKILTNIVLRNHSKNRFYG